MNMIQANLSYGVTGDEEALNIYAMENQIKTLDDELDETIKLSQESGGNGSRFIEMIREISKRIVALREQVEFAKQKLDSNDANKVELERIRKILLDQRIAFYEYDDVTVRLLVEYIKVMSDGKIVIVLKGGEEIEERL